MFIINSVFHKEMDECAVVYIKDTFLTIAKITSRYLGRFYVSLTPKRASICKETCNMYCAEESWARVLECPYILWAAVFATDEHFGN